MEPGTETGAGESWRTECPGFEVVEATHLTPQEDDIKVKITCAAQVSFQRCRSVCPLCPRPVQVPEEQEYRNVRYTPWMLPTSWTEGLACIKLTLDSVIIAGSQTAGVGTTRPCRGS